MEIPLRFGSLQKLLSLRHHNHLSLISISKRYVRWYLLIMMKMYLLRNNRLFGIVYERTYVGVSYQTANRKICKLFNLLWSLKLLNYACRTSVWRRFCAANERYEVDLWRWKTSNWKFLMPMLAQVVSSSTSLEILPTNRKFISIYFEQGTI